MPYTINYNPTLDVIELIQSELFSAIEMRDATSTAISLGSEMKCTDFLIDLSNATIDASLFDILDLPAKQYTQDGASRLSRIAVIAPTHPESQEAIRFYENACLNRGWSAKLFSDRQAALAWLRTGHT